MKIYKTTDFLQKYKHNYFFVDTNVLIGALSVPPLKDFLVDLKEQNNSLLTIQSVYFEFVRGSIDLDAFKIRTEMFSSLFDVYPIERSFNDFSDFIFILQKVSSKMSYPDFLLAMCLYKFKEALLITENHSDFPLSIFDRVEVITIDSGKDIRNYAIYKVSLEKLEKASAKILNEKKSLSG